MVFKNGESNKGGEAPRLSVRLSSSALVAKARRLVGGAIRLAGPFIETKSYDAAAYALRGVYKMENCACFYEQMIKQLQSGADIIQIFHPRVRIDGNGADFSPYDALIGYQSLGRAASWQESFNIIGEEQVSPMTMPWGLGSVIAGISSAELSEAVVPIVEYLQSLIITESTKLPPAEVIYGELAWLISTNLINTLRPDICRAHYSGKNFISSLGSLAHDLERGHLIRRKLSMTVSFGCALNRALEGGSRKNASV